MTRGLALLTVGICLFGSVVAIGSQQSRPVFRTSSSSVAVNVSVRSGNRPVVGLVAKDFVLTDQGVPQVVSEVTFESVPIDVTLVLDASGSGRVAWRDSVNDLKKIGTMLRPIDRIRVLVFDAEVREAVPLQPVLNATWKDPDIGNTSAVYQGLVAAMMTLTEPGRRRFIVAITDGYENSSTVDLPRLQAIAARSDAVLWILRKSPGVPLDRPFTRPQAPIYPEAPFEALDDAAKATGGGLKWGDPVSTFKELFAEFRDSYVLHFVPTGVAGAGWHELSVKLNAGRNHEIRFRRGYFASN